MGEMLTLSLFHEQTRIVEPMVEWNEFEAAEPTIAQKIRSRFEDHPHHVLGTIEFSGAPRLSGINVFFNDGLMWFGSMSQSRKVADIERDPRVTIHTATLSEEMLGGDGRVSGFAVPLDASQIKNWKPESSTDGVYFGVNIDKVHLVEIVNEQLVISMWDIRHGLRIVTRQ